jgi:hypothetical protein
MGAVRLAKGEGPLGTGVFLLRERRVEPHALEAQAWLLLAFLPLVPRGRVRLTLRQETLAAADGAPLYDDAERLPLEPGDAAATYARGLAALALVLLSVTLGYLCVAESSWLGGLGVLLGGGLPLALLGWLDQSVPRLRAARPVR